MRRKIIRSFIIAFTIAFAVGLSVLYTVLYSVFLDRQEQQQFQELQLLSAMQDDFDAFEEYLLVNDARLTVIDVDGQVLYDSQVESIGENHLERTEVSLALENERGRDIRYSSTTGINYLYTAIYNRQNDRIYRLAVPFEGISQSMIVILPSFVIAFFVALLVVWFISKKMAASLVKPLQDISRTIWMTRIGQETITFEDYHYPELEEITDSIRFMNDKIVTSMERVKKEKQIRQDFFANASHELKTPLTSISGYTELLRTHTITEPKQVDRCLDRVLDEARNMTQMVNDILQISKLESDQYRAAFTHVDMEEVIQSVLQRFHIPIEKMSLDITVDADPVIVYANRQDMEGLTENLISNAIKYNVYEGSINISCRANGEYAVLKVEDTGIGIAEEDQERVFQRFYRVDKQRSKTIAGTGLGLSIVKHLVQFYKGTVVLTSKEQKGTAITVSLPILVQNIPDHS